MILTGGSHERESPFLSEIRGNLGSRRSAARGAAPAKSPCHRTSRRRCAAQAHRQPVRFRGHVQRLRRARRVQLRADRFRIGQDTGPPARTGHHQGRLDPAHASSSRPVPGRSAGPSSARHSHRRARNTNGTCSRTPRTSGATAASSTSTTSATTSTPSPRTFRWRGPLPDYGTFRWGKIDFFILPTPGAHARIDHPGGQRSTASAWRSPAT